MDLNELNNEHREIAQKLMEKVRDDQSNNVMDKITHYNAFLKTWQERLGLEGYIAKLEEATSTIESPTSGLSVI